MISSFVAWGVASFAVSVVAFLFCKAFGLTNLYVHGGLKLPPKDAPPAAYALIFLFMCVIAPITEELLFRMVLFKIGLALTSSIIAVVLITSILFALVHATDKPAFPLPQLFGGVIMGVGFLYGGIWFSIGIHATHNFCAFLWLISIRVWNKVFG